MSDGQQPQPHGTDSRALTESMGSTIWPDLLIADIGMPDEDGYSLMRRIRALPGAVGAIPAIALSAYTRAEARGSAEDAGFTRFIPKPATPQDLLRAIDALLNPVQQPSRSAVDDH